MGLKNQTLTLGYQANLLNGILPEWNTRDGAENPLFSPNQTGLIEAAALPVQPKPTFTSQVTLHFSWQDLIAKLYSSVQVTQAKLQKINCALVIGEPSQANIEADLANRLGVKIEDTTPDRSVGFALVTIRKVVSPLTIAPRTHR